MSRRTKSAERGGGGRRPKSRDDRGRAADASTDRRRARRPQAAATARTPWRRQRRVPGRARGAPCRRIATAAPSRMIRSGAPKQQTSDEDHADADEAAEPGASTTETQGETRADAERRRRRRGRRGGRRNRRDRDGEAPSASDNGHAGEPELSRAVADFDAGTAPEPVHEQPVLHEQRGRAGAQRACARNRNYEPPEDRPPPAAVPAVAAPEAPESAAQERPRRRSTVREPAPMVFSGEAMAPIPHQSGRGAAADRERAGAERGQRSSAPLRLVEQARARQGLTPDGHRGRMKAAGSTGGASASSTATPATASAAISRCASTRHACSAAIPSSCCTAAATPR